MLYHRAALRSAPTREPATDALVSTFATTLLAELGDKSFFVALVLAASGRPVAVAAGAITAFAALNLVAVAVGAALGELPREPVLGTAAALFVGAGLWALARPSASESAEDRSPAATQAWPVFVAAFTAIGVSELGDKTQLAVALLAARFDSPVWVFVGGTAGVAATSCLAVWAGSRLAGRLPVRTLKRLAGAVFVAMGLWTLAELWLGAG